ncbi:MAG: ABC transporter ATP-binding protein [Myxococcales bacterium]|jgi:ABC-type multidrug transport system ATPase subunit|nr:ABC transporter ATP-binding protein [Myxococcales bacterium]
MVQPQVALHAVHRSYAQGPLWRRERRPVLRGVDLSLDPGEALVLRGDNGAGKTTVLRLIAGLVVPDSGSVEVLGRAPHRDGATRARVGWVGGDGQGLFPRLTGRHNLEFFAALHALPGAETARRIAALDEELELGEALDRRAGECSTGMKARLTLARALLHEPTVLLLDEVTRSLDDHHTRAVHRALRRRIEAGATVIASSHRADDAAGLRAPEGTLRDGELISHAVPTAERATGAPTTETRDSETRGSETRGSETRGSETRATEEHG